MSDRRSLRVRLTATFALAFALGGGALTAAGYAIVAHTLPRPLQAEQLTVPERVSTTHTVTVPSTAGSTPHATSTTSPQPVPAGAVATVRDAQARQRVASLHHALLLFLSALAVVIAASVAAGWAVAGRALAPIRKITATARAISADRLDDRIALRGPDDELRELAETFDGMLARLEHSFAVQSRFVASASHELQTPLTLVRTEADVVLEDPDASAAELREALVQVRAGAQRGGDLVEALLALARSGSTLETTEQIDLTTVLHAAVAAARPRADAVDITITETHDLDPPITVRGDATLLRALVDNLIANAITYNRTSGEVSITATTRKDATTLHIVNTGPPVPADHIDRLFAPFARGEPSRARRTGGAGLGLAIVRTVAEAHGGTATATPGPHGGLDVLVLLKAPHH